MRIDQLNGLEIIGSQSLSGVDCVIVRGTFPTMPIDLKLWIGKSDHLIRKGEETENSRNAVATFDLRNIHVDSKLDEKDFAKAAER